MPNLKNEYLQPFNELTAGAGSAADSTLLKLFREAIPDSALSVFLKGARGDLQYDKDISASDLLMPLTRHQWPHANLSELNWAISEVIFGYKSAAGDLRVVFAYLGALYVYCQVRGRDVDDTHISTAAAAIVEGTSGTNLGIQIQLLHLLSWAIAEVRSVNQRSYDPRPILCYVATVLLTRLVRACAKSTELLLLQFALADPFETQPKVLSEFLEADANDLMSAGREVFLGTDGALSVLHSFCQTCFYPTNQKGTPN